MGWSRRHRPVVTVPQGAISFNFQSAENLGTAAGDLTPLLDAEST